MKLTNVCTIGIVGVSCVCMLTTYLWNYSLDVIKGVKEFWSNNFEIKDLGEADVILNIKLLREGNGGVTLLQSHYV